MKKILSLLIAILMLSGMLSLLIVPAAADGEPVDTVLRMYISDNGSDSNDGLTPATPVKTINKAIQYMKQNVGDGFDQKSAELILVGDLTVSSSYLIYDHKWFSLTVKSEDGTMHSLILKNVLRIGGETLFTNIKILNMATENRRGVIMADQGKLTIGREGIANDVITYELGVSNAPLNISGGSPTRSYNLESVDVTINCGTYGYISTATWCWGTYVTGDINFVINDASIIDGYIAIGGGLQPELGDNNVETGNVVALEDTGLICGGDYNVVINGGMFTRTKFVVGAAGTGKYGDEIITEDVVVDGNTVIDFNGGTFSNCSIITGESLGEGFLADVTKVDFKNGIEVNIFDLDADTAAIVTAMVNAADKADTLTKNKITVVNHNYTKIEQLDATTHKKTCVCGCGDSITEPHKFGEPVVLKEATHLEAGSEKYTCACGYEEVREIARFESHSYGETFEWHDDTHCKRVCECGEMKLSEHVFKDGKCTRCGGADPSATAVTESSVQTEEAPAQSGGCSSTVGMGIAFAAFAGAAAVFTCKKKKD